MCAVWYIQSAKSSTALNRDLALVYARPRHLTITLARRATVERPDRVIEPPVRRHNPKQRTRRDDHNGVFYARGQ